MTRDKKKKYHKTVLPSETNTVVPVMEPEQIRKELAGAYNVVADRWMYKQLQSIGTGQVGRSLGRRRYDLFWRGWKRVLLQDKAMLPPILVAKIEAILRSEPDKPGPFTRFIREHLLQTSMGALEGFRFNLEPICVCLDLLLDHMTPEEDDT